MRLARLPIFFASLCLLFGVVSTQAATIAVAANMKDAFTEIANVFKANINAAPMKIVYGSSGNFAAQIQNGAPFNLFIAADERFPLELYKSGKTIDDGSVYAIGKLAVLFKASSEETLLDNKASIGHAISRANKIAIAKPDLSPYGKATVAYLRAEGLWDQAKGKLVYGDNISAATNYVLVGAADLGFTALSLAKSLEVAKDTKFIPLDGKSYEPIRQRMVLIKSAPPEAIELYRFMQSPQAKSILQKYGYITP